MMVRGPGGEATPEEPEAAVVTVAGVPTVDAYPQSEAGGAIEPMQTYSPAGLLPVMAQPILQRFPTFMTLLESLYVERL